MVRGRAIGHERPLAAGRNHHADPTCPLASDASRADMDTVSFEGGYEATSLGIAADRADERRASTETGEPSSGRRSRAALAQGDATRNVGPAQERTRRRQHDIDHQVAEHD